MLKKSINRWAFESSLSIEECMKMAKKHSFDAIELNLEETGDFSLETPEKDVLGLKQKTAEYGINISSLCSLLFWKYPITSSDPEIRQKGVDIIKRMIEYASLLNVDTILVVPGMVHADPPLDFGNPPVSYTDAWERAKKIIQELADFAVVRNVTIGLENVFYNKFLLSPREFKEFLEDVNRRNVKIYFDVGNTMICGFPEDWIGILNERICSIHCKDFDKNVNTLYGWRNVFEGHINWNNVCRAIKNAGYDGYLVGEPALSPYLFQQEELIRNTSSALDKLREMILCV